MARTRITSIAGSLCLILTIGAIGLAQDTSSRKFKDAISQSNKAARVFAEIMSAPDSSIPEHVLDRAACVAVFPNVIKGGFIVGGRGGRGVASCRAPGGWSAPAYFNLGGGSFGLQIGAQATDFVLLFMNREGMNKLLEDKFEVGGDASVAAGPVGRQTGASTDIQLEAQILSYSRSKGLFAGLELKGVVIKPAKKDMKAVYGEGVTAKDVLREGEAEAPAEVRRFPNALSKYSARKAKR